MQKYVGMEVKFQFLTSTADRRESSVSSPAVLHPYSLDGRLGRP